MKTIDVFFGQNWVDQAQREHSMHPNSAWHLQRISGSSCETIVNAHKSESIAYLMTWACTEQGRMVWSGRHGAFLDLTQDLLR